MRCWNVWQETYFRVQGGSRGAKQGAFVFEVDWGGDFSEIFDGFIRGLLERLRDDGWVDALLQHLFCGPEETPSQDYNGRGTITSFDVLCSTKIDKLILGSGASRVNTFIGCSPSWPLGAMLGYSSE